MSETTGGAGKREAKVSTIPAASVARSTLTAAITRIQAAKGLAGIVDFDQQAPVTDPTPRAAPAAPTYVKYWGTSDRWTGECRECGWHGEYQLTQSEALADTREHVCPPEGAAPGAGEMAQQPEARGVAVSQRHDGAWMSRCGGCGWEGMAMLSRAPVVREADAHRCPKRPPTAPEPESAAGEGREALLLDLLRRARRNVEHSASHPAGAKSRELLAEIDAALNAEVPHV